MTLIEGVGDEVVQFAAAVLLIVVAVLAWWSTNAIDPNRYRAVLVMRSRRRPVTVSIQTDNTVAVTNNQVNPVQPSAELNAEEAYTVSRIATLDELVDWSETNMAMMSNSHVQVYRRVDSHNTNQSSTETMTDEVEVPEESEPASNEQIREMDSIVNAMEADITERCTRTTVTESKPTTPQGIKHNTINSASTMAPETIAASENPTLNTENVVNSEDNVRKIHIRLKYLNDTQKMVEGSLDELLKDFKWRHFSTELSSESRVRLIFNGRVLVDDTATLQACGLHDKAVVHCLVHPKRNNQQQRGTSEEPPVNATAEIITDAPPAERAWDLENILMTLVSVALTVVWFFRCEYSNMFTATASVALFGLTVFYSVAIFGLYLTDTYHFGRRPPNRPVPNN